MYSDLLKDPRWQKKRLEVLASTGWACEKCEATDSTLHVHHKRYIKGRKPWEYRSDELVVLCQTCHRGEHSDQLLLNQVLACLPVGMTLPTAGILGGFLDAALEIEDRFLVEEIRQVVPSSYELGIALALMLGGSEWRQFIREFAKNKPTTPPVRHLIERWDEAGRSPNGKENAAL